jgi:hypothetical protein
MEFTKQIHEAVPAMKTRFLREARSVGSIVSTTEQMEGWMLFSSKK